MNILGTIITYFIVSVLITLFLFALFGSRGPWGSIWAVLITIFLFIWAASLWTRPIGPVVYGVAWVPIILIGLLIAFLLIAASPPYYRSRTRFKIRRRKDRSEKENDMPVTAAIDIFFWLVAGILIIAIISSYFIN